MWELLDKIGLVLGIISFIPIVLSFRLLLLNYRRQRKIRQEISQSPGQRPAILIVDVGAGSIQNQVNNWRKQQLGIKDISIMEYLGHSGELKVEELDKFIDEFRKTQIKIMEAGTDKIHLFFRGPTMLATMIGAELSNGIPVLLYHLEQNGVYKNWGPLSRGWI